MSQKYSLMIYNDSNYTGQFIVYPNPPQSDIDPSQISPLAWLSVRVQGRDGKVRHAVEFDWSLDYGFAWSGIGVLQPGVTFAPASVVPIASLSPPVGNKIFLTKEAGHYAFTNPQDGKERSIEVVTTGAVVSKQAAIGVVLSGASAFAVPAWPNIRNDFVPSTSYTIALGSYQRGQVMDIDQLSGLNPVKYGPGVHQLVFTYNENGTWTQGPPAGLAEKRDDVDPERQPAQVTRYSLGSGGAPQ